MKATRLSLAAFLLTCSAASAQQVYDGCVVPPDTYAHAWYFDPAAPAGGNGSQASPWNNLEAVFQAVTGVNNTYPYLTTGAFNKGHGGPIQPGDEILLATGDYGAISVGMYATSVDNGTNFVRVAAAPGAEPVFTSLTVNPAHGFVFSGISISPVTPTNTSPALVTVAGDAAYPTSNIILNHMTLSSNPISVIDAMSAAQMIATMNVGVNLVGGSAVTCVALDNSHIFGEHFGLLVGTNNTLVANNEIDHVLDDTVAYNASYLAFRRNFAHDPMEVGIGAHKDGFQGYGGVFTNIVFNGNRIQDQVDPSNPFPTWLDCINNYAYETSSYANVKVKNNTCVTSSTSGILFGRLTNSEIVNNTLVQSSLGTGGPSITLNSLSPGANITVLNNLTTALNIASNDPTVVLSHNVVMSLGTGGPTVYCAVNGVLEFQGLPGPVCGGNGNFVDGVGAVGELMAVNIPLLNYDLQPLPASLAETAGTPTGAPPLNILGQPRVVTNGTIPVGAY